MDQGQPVTRSSYAGIFFIALVTLSYQIILTRVFSVTMWYHFAFIAITVAMFGLAVGAIIVYRQPQRFPQEHIHSILGRYSLYLSLSIIASFILFLQIPLSLKPEPLNAVWALLDFSIIAVPFIISGIIVCLVLTRFPKQVGSLYCFDLLGAGIGCLVVLLILEMSDPSSAIFLVAAGASLAAMFFSSATRRAPSSYIATSIFLIAFSFYNGHLAKNGEAIVGIKWVKGKIEGPKNYETWNSHSRVIVVGDPTNKTPYKELGPGWSSSFDQDFSVEKVNIVIDSTASTAITRFSGKAEEIEYLRYHIGGLAHRIRDNADVLVVGVGGGVDVLSAVAYGQKSVVGVEMNKAVLDVLTNQYGDYAGNFHLRDDVTLIHDEARSFIASNPNTYDIIQVSFIDTWAATAAGAYVLSENALYTVDAWKIFLSRLNTGGLLTLNRWYFDEFPGEMYRMVSTAHRALTEMGVENPRNHILVARAPKVLSWVAGVGNLIVSPNPLSEEDISRFEKNVEEMGYTVALSPRTSIDKTFDALTSADKSSVDKFLDNHIFDLSAPTDDRPFFFNMLRISDIFNPIYRLGGPNEFNLNAVGMLGVLILIVLIMSALCIVFPLRRTANKTVVRESKLLFYYFGAIGFGFMFVEITQLQRLIILLGHPTYSLSVVLFCLLVFSGLGSYTTRFVTAENVMRQSKIRLGSLLLVLLVCGYLTSNANTLFQESELSIRIAISAVIVSLLGFFMGMAFPLGLQSVKKHSEFLTPWLWGINGVTSVCGSVFAVAISMSYGISFTYALGILSYLIALLALHKHQTS